MRYIRKLFQPTCLLFVALTIGLGASASVEGQKALPQDLTPQEKALIEREKKEKDIAELLIRFSSERLVSARASLMSENYEHAASQVKSYKVLSQYTSQVIGSSIKKDSDRKKICKLFEQSLRRDIEILEMLRYQIPQKYATDVEDAYQQTSKLRETALEAVFGNDFFKESEN